MYYIGTKPLEISKNSYEPMELNDKLKDKNYQDSMFPEIVRLMLSKEKLEYRNFKVVLRCHQPSLHKNTEQYVHHLVFAFYPFCQEQKLKSAATRTYFGKLQELSEMYSKKKTSQYSQ